MKSTETNKKRKGKLSTRRGSSHWILSWITYGTEALLFSRIMYPFASGQAKVKRYAVVPPAGSNNWLRFASSLFCYLFLRLVAGNWSRHPQSGPKMLDSAFFLGRNISRMNSHGGRAGMVGRVEACKRESEQIVSLTACLSVPHCFLSAFLPMPFAVPLAIFD